MRSTNRSKLFIDFYPVGRNPGTSESKTGFELEKQEGRLSLGLAGKVERQEYAFWGCLFHLPSRFLGGGQVLVNATCK